MIPADESFPEDLPTEDEFHADELIDDDSIGGDPIGREGSADRPIPDAPVLRDVIVPDSAAGQRIDLFLTGICDGYSRSQIRAAVQGDGCEVDGRVIRPSYKVRPGQRVCFAVPDVLSDDTVPENISLDVLYEDDGFVVVNKPAGMVVHPARGNWTGTLTSALAYRFQSLSDVGGPTRPGIVHRLDRDTSGVIVVAKTNAVHMNLAQQWADRTVEKEYLAVTGAPIDRDRDLIDMPIGRHPYQRDKQAIRIDHETSKPASTFFEVLSRHGRFTVVACRPKTGRTHQIRVHMAHIGSPVLCDRLYAGHSEITAAQMISGLSHPDGRHPLATLADETVVMSRQALHAHRLTLTNPQTGRQMTFTAPPAADMQNVIDLISWSA